MGRVKGGGHRKWSDRRLMAKARTLERRAEKLLAQASKLRLLVEDRH